MNFPHFIDNSSFYRMFSKVFSVSLMLWATLVSASPKNITEAELQILPQYCRDTMWFPVRHKEHKSYWISRMGNTFIHMHHYCWGLANLNRALKSEVRLGKKMSGLNDVLSDFNYVVNAAPRDFVLLPEIYTRIGEVELMLKEPNKADEAFTQARSLKPDYWPAYSHWVEFLIRTGKRSEALQMLIIGLKYAPEAKVLREQYRLLGGAPEIFTSQSKEPNEAYLPESDTRGHQSTNDN